MKWRALGLTLVAGLVVGSGLALAQEDGPGAARPQRPRRRGEGGPQMRRPGGLAGLLAGDTPAVREEMERHATEMRQILEALRPQAGQAREKIRELREQGATREEIMQALRPDGAKAAQVAGEIADALATHYENLAKIFREHREAVAKSIARSVARRAILRGGPRGGPGPEGGPGQGPGGEGFRPRRRPGEQGGPPFPPRRPRPEEPEEGAPANF